MSTQRRKKMGKTAYEEESQSGDCDDEDECEDGSGKSGLRIRNQLRFIPELDYDLDIDEVPFNKQMRNQQDQNGREITHLQSGSDSIKTVSAKLLLPLTITLLGLVSVN